MKTETATMKMITLFMPKYLLSIVDEIVEKNPKYTSRSDLIRRAIIMYLLAEKLVTKEQLIEKIKSMS